MKLKIIKKSIKIFTVTLMAACTALLGAISFENYRLPDSYMLIEGEELQLSGALPVKAAYSGARQSEVSRSSPLAGENYQTELKLFGIFPIKSASVSVIDELYVKPSGEAFGIKIFTSGVIVVGLSSIDTKDGDKRPAESAGIKLSDNITSIDGKEVSTNEDVAGIIAASEGRSLRVELVRDGKEMTVYLTPEKTKGDGVYRAGMWVRDSSAGIGTLTFYSPVTGVAAGLGHGICDVDTGELLPLSFGEMVTAEIFDVAKSVCGSPGELKGRFLDETIGNLMYNSDIGIYGCYNSEISANGLIPIGLKQEIVEGDATVITTIDSGAPKEYSCVIEKVRFNSENSSQNMIIRITDEQLITKCGGIVQGMSGSPIIQNGKLIGAVTHVFVGEPEKGYAIFAETMFDYAKNVKSVNN